MLRPRTVLLIGVVVTMLGAATYAVTSMQAALYVTACQPGTEWSRAPGCRQILLQLWAGIILTSVGIAVIAYGVIVRLLKAHRKKTY
jgi:uncharacterized membrane protein